MDSNCLLGVIGSPDLVGGRDTLQSAPCWSADKAAQAAAEATAALAASVDTITAAATRVQTPTAGQQEVVITPDSKVSQANAASSAGATPHNNVSLQATASETARGETSDSSSGGSNTCSKLVIDADSGKVLLRAMGWIDSIKLKFDKPAYTAG